jgi:plasmid stabilization system protein ParE
MPAKFRVSLTRAAESDIEQAWSFIAQDSPEAADKFIGRLEQQIETLEIFPNRYALIPENQILGTRYRHMIYGDYRTVFRVAKRTVYVLRVIHGARLLDATLFEELE